MEHSYRFFENKACKYFPCHQGLEDFNCLFCYCPLYAREHCPGNPRYIEKDGRKIKVCTNCTFPHQPENYDIIIQALQGKNTDSVSDSARKNTDSASDTARKNTDSISDNQR